MPDVRISCLYMLKKKKNATTTLFIIRPECVLCETWKCKFFIHLTVSAFKLFLLMIIEVSVCL